MFAFMHYVSITVRGLFFAAKQLCLVKYSYTAQNEDELTLTEGDKVTILSKNLEDPGWWRGELNGKVGVFPDNFVEIIGKCRIFPKQFI